MPAVLFPQGVTPPPPKEGEKPAKLPVVDILDMVKNPKKFIEENIKRGLDAPVAGVGGVFGTTTKIITKTPGLLKGALIGGGAVLAGSMLLGGGKDQEQKQKQDITQVPKQDVDTTQVTPQNQDTTTTPKQIVDQISNILPSSKDVYDFTAGRDIQYYTGGISSTPSTAQPTIVAPEQRATPISITPQITISQPTQGQQATSMDTSGLMIAAAVIGAILLLKGK